MKYALLGLANNISSHLSKIKMWADSFKKHSDGDVVLLCANATTDEMMQCQNIGIKTVYVQIEDTWFINHKRLEHTSNFLENCEYDMLIVTDVFDVFFQRDPFAQLDTNEHDVFISGEGVKVAQEPWNADNITKIFPESIEMCLHNEVVNSGVIAGKKESLNALYKAMYELCETGSDEHNIKDQAALNVLVARKSITNLKIFNLDDSWAVHCAVAGPTQFFEGWGFKDNIPYGLPVMENSIVVSGQNTPYSVVHQFNRIPEWATILKTKINE